MDYYSSYTELKKLFNEKKDCISIDSMNLEIQNVAFKSKARRFLYFKEKIRDKFMRTILGKKDSKIKENKKFVYPMFRRPGSKRADNIIILLHGLNEKDWSKYLPWANALLEKTGKSVLLFPIAFHMNRAPRIWRDPKIMNKIIFIRKLINPSIEKETFVNVALSSRLQSFPQRFCLSGLETIYDMQTLMKIIRSDKHPYVDKSANIDIFAYSIGGFLTEILLMSDKANLFQGTKAFLFCSGSTFNLMNGTSKYILDTAANQAIYDFFIEHFEEELQKDKKLNSIVNDSLEGYYFNAMLNYDKMQSARNFRMTELAKRIQILCLTKDTVIPPEAIFQTMQKITNMKNGSIQIEEIDPPFKYTHENPFPTAENLREQVDQSFNEIFDRAASFLSN
jgi:hypothetical protein